MVKEEERKKDNESHPNVVGDDDDRGSAYGVDVEKAVPSTDELAKQSKKKSKKKRIRSRSPFRAVGKVGKAMGKVGSATAGTVSSAAHEITRPLTSTFSKVPSSHGRVAERGRSRGGDSNPATTDLPTSIVVDPRHQASAVSQLEGGDTATAVTTASGHSNYGSVASSWTGGGSAATTATLNTAKAVIALPKKIVKKTVKGVTKTAEFTHHEATKLLGSHGGGVTWNRSGVSGKKPKSPRQSILPLGVTPLFKDNILPTMEPMFTKYLQGVTVEEWAETCWFDAHEEVGGGPSDVENGFTIEGTTTALDEDDDDNNNAYENDNTDQNVINNSTSSVFGSFLEATGNSNIVMGPWNTSDDGQDTFQGDWDKELYSHRRVITYDKPGGGFSSGPIKVKQTQNLRYENQDTGDGGAVAIVAFTVNILSGIPYNDAFEVQVRWVASPMPVTGPPVIRLQVGCCVVFSKKVMVAGIIKSNTISSSLDDQNNTLEAMKAACNAIEVPKPKLVSGLSLEDQAEDDDKSDDEQSDAGRRGNGCGIFFSKFLMCFFNGLVWAVASFTSAVVKSVLDNESVQQSGARFLVQVVENASADPELGEALTSLFPSRPVSTTFMDRNESSEFLRSKSSLPSFHHHHHHSQSIESISINSHANRKSE